MSKVKYIMASNFLNLLCSSGLLIQWLLLLSSLLLLLRLLLL